ncbi:MAG: zinc ABC transporter substrate-binding protein [Chlamydiales bacterium]|nr:zinc ABC transporter substrate-binding protein [Chlamydiales bacterium]
MKYKRFLRRYLKWIIPSLLLITLFSCSDSRGKSRELDSWASNNGKVKVLSTTGMIDDLVEEIGKERVDHIKLILGEIDPHSYELVKGDDEKISSAQVVFYNGLGLEHGASLRYRLESHPCKVSLGSELEKRAPDEILMVGNQVDPHIWMDISLWARAVDPIVETLSQIDAEHADYYYQNGEALKNKMLAVHQEIVQKFKTAPEEKRYLVASHDAFNYFARAYLAGDEERRGGEWQKRFAAPEGLAPDGQLGYTDIKKIIDHLILHQIDVVFPESNVSRDSLKKIASVCKEMGHRVRISPAVLYGDAMQQSGPVSDGYLNMLRHNCNVMVEQWSKHE